MIATAAFLAVLAGCTDEAIVGTNDGDGFFLNRTVLDLNKGTSETLVATVTPKDAAGVSWTSDNTAVATVDGNGQVTAVGAGDALIQAKAGSRTLECRVHVTSLVTTVSLDRTKVDTDKGETVVLKATAGPEDINVPMDTVWTSSNEAVLTVEKGVVKAVGGGEATVVVAINGVSATCDLRALLPHRGRHLPGCRRGQCEQHPPVHGEPATGRRHRNAGLPVVRGGRIPRHDR